MNKFIKQNKKLAVILCILFISSLFLSMTYIFTEANHECIGTHCPICAHIQAAERIIGELGTALVMIAHVGLTFSIICTIPFLFIVDTVLSTPITKYVRMNA